MSQNCNVPYQLQPLIDRWNKEGKEYFLGPGNMFIYNGHKVTYHGGEDIPVNGWYASNGTGIQGYTLSKSDVEEIQRELLQHYKTTKWTLLLDWRCNYNCKMCPYHGYGVSEHGDYYSDRDEQMQTVSQETAFHWIDILSQYGIKNLSVASEGEILLYPHWREVSGYAHAKGMNLWTITNGSLWNEELVREAAALGYTDIRVSLDALTYDTYALIRSKRKDYYENAMKLPQLLMKYGITTNVHFVKQKENIHEVNDFLEYWKKKNVNSISIANEFVYEGQVVVNRFAKAEKEYIKGLCMAFGNMETMASGKTVCCCGQEAKLNIGNMLERYGCEKIVKKAAEQMRDENSELSELCSRCSLYVPYYNEQIVEGWKVTKTYERETWYRLKTN